MQQAKWTEGHTARQSSVLGKRLRNARLSGRFCGTLVLSLTGTGQARGRGFRGDACWSPCRKAEGRQAVEACEGLSGLGRQPTETLHCSPDDRGRETMRSQERSYSEQMAVEMLLWALVGMKRKSIQACPRGAVVSSQQGPDQLFL